MAIVLVVLLLLRLKAIHPVLCRRCRRRLAGKPATKSNLSLCAPARVVADRYVQWLLARDQCCAQNWRFGFADQQPWCAKKRTAPGGIASLDRPKTPDDGPFLPLNKRQPAMLTSIVQLLGTAATDYGVLAARSVLTQAPQMRAATPARSLGLLRLLCRRLRIWLLYGLSRHRSSYRRRAAR